MFSKSENVSVQSSFFFLIIASIVAPLSGLNEPLRAQEASGTSSAAREWERYTLKDRKLSVMLPIFPAMISYSSDYWHPASKKRLRNLVGAYSQGVGYVIEIYDVKQSLDQFIAESRPDNFTREVTVSGIRGKEYLFEDVIGRRITQYFYLDSRVYCFKAYSSRLGNPDVDMPKFLQSIKFDKNSAGRPLVEGFGAQPSPQLSGVTDERMARIFSGKEVTYKARVLMKPEPRYTEEARQNQVTGTVVLRAVFSSSGTITNIRAVSGLPNGLTDRAIAAARQIRFIPAIKDGQFVSMYIQLEYNFNLY